MLNFTVLRTPILFNLNINHNYPEASGDQLFYSTEYMSSYLTLKMSATIINASSTVSAPGYSHFLSEMVSLID